MALNTKFHDKWKSTTDGECTYHQHLANVAAAAAFLQLYSIIAQLNAHVLRPLYSEGLSRTLDHSSLVYPIHPEFRNLTFPSLNVDMSIVVNRDVIQKSKLNGKQCRSYWDGSLSSGSTLSAHSFGLVYRNKRVPLISLTNGGYFERKEFTPSATGYNTYRIRPNYRTYSYKRTVKQFRRLQITASILFVYFFIKTYVVGTHNIWEEYPQHMPL